MLNNSSPSLSSRRSMARGFFCIHTKTCWLLPRPVPDIKSEGASLARDTTSMFALINTLRRSPRITPSPDHTIAAVDAAKLPRPKRPQRIDLVVNRGFVALRPFWLHRAWRCHIGAPLVITLAIDGALTAYTRAGYPARAFVAGTHLAILAPPVVLRHACWVWSDLYSR
jgi:hypothetical protein